MAKVLSDIHFILFSIAVFISAIVLSKAITTSVATYQKTVEAAIDGNMALKSSDKIVDYAGVDTITYEQMCSIMMTDLDYHIFINDKEYLPDTYNFNTFDFTTISKTNFTVSYKFDVNGNIETVIYRSI